MHATLSAAHDAPSYLALPADLLAPVIVDFITASTPRGAIACRLAAEASVLISQLNEPRTDKASKLRKLATTRVDMFHLNPYLIQMKPGRNSRVMSDPANLAHIDELARSIAVEGVKEPVTVAVEGDQVFLTAGHSRLFATFRAIEVYGADIASIPVVPESSRATERDYVLRQVLGEKPLAPLELGDAYVKMHQGDAGWSTQQIAAKVGKSKMHVEQVLSLMAGTTPVVRALVESDQITASTVALVLRRAQHDPALTEQVVLATVASAAAAGKHRATPKHMPKPAAKAKPDRLKALLRSILAAPSTIIVTGIGTDETTTITLSAPFWTAFIDAITD